MGIPNPPILGDPTTPIRGVPGPDGVLLTAVKPSSPRPAQPPQVPVGAGGPSGDAGAPAGGSGVALGDLTPDVFAALVAQEGAAGGPAGAQTLQPTLAPERVLGRQEAATEATGFGQFAPRDLTEAQQVGAGSFGAAFRSGMSDSLMGWMFGTNPEAARDRDRNTAELMNYAAQNPWSATVGQIAGGFAGDAPLEVVLALGTLGVGNGVITAARAAGRGANSLRMMAGGIQRLKRAYRLNAGKSLSRQGFKRALARGGFEASLGVTAGTISEVVQQSLGKPGDMDDVAFRATLDGLASVPFAETLRFGGRALRFTNRQIARRLAKTAAADVNGVKASQVVDGIERGLDEAGEEARFRTDDQTALNRAIDDEEQLLLRELDPAARKRVKKNMAEVRKKGNRRALISALEDMIEGDAAARKAGARRVVNLIERRARSAGKTLQSYMDTKRVRLRLQNDPSQIITNTNNIIAAPFRATSVADLFHEIGHLVFADLNNAHRNAARRFLGVSPDRPLSRENYEGFADAFVRFLETGTAKSRGAKRMFQEVARWFRNVYNRLTKRPEEPDIDDLFRKLIPEDEARIDEPFAVPGTARELTEARVRAEQGLERLFARPPAAKAATGAVAKKLSPQDEKDRSLTARTQDKIKNRAQAAADEFEDSPFIPKTKRAKALNSVQRKMGELLYAFNLSLNSYSDRLGTGFTRLKLRLQNAVQDAAALKVKWNEKLGAAIKRGNITPDKTAKLYDNKRDVTLETTDGEQAINLDGIDRMKLTMYALDGFDKNLDADKITRNSAQQSLTAKNAGFLDPNTGKRVVLTKAELQRIQNGSLLDAEERTIMNALFETYRSVVPDANRTGKKLLNQNLVNPENFFYNPKSTDATNLSDDIWAVGSALIGDKDAKKLLGDRNLRARSGAAALKLTDPLQEMSGYLNRMSDVLAKSEVMASYKIAMDKAGPRIEAVFGRSVRNSLDDLIKVNSGDSSKLGAFTEGNLANRLFSAGMIGKLSLNPSVALKQLASSFTAAATGKVKSSGFVMGQQALEFASNSRLRKQVVDEMAEHNPMMAQRLREEPQFIEVERAIKGMGPLQQLHGKLDTKTVLEMVKRGEIKAADALIDMLRKGTIGIKVLDEATLGSIWQAVKKDVTDEGFIQPNSKMFWGEVNRRWNDILLETQPTTDPSARSINQMRRGILPRFLTMYSTQTRKNWELIDKTVSKYLNVEKPTADDREQLVQVLAPLLYQTAYVTAVGTAYGFGFNKALTLLQSEKRQRQIEQHQETLTVKLFNDSMRNLLGQRPIIGKLASDFAGSMLGTKPFKQGVPVLDELSKVNEGISQRSIRRTLDGSAQLIGIPTLIRRPVSETVGKLQE